MAGRTLYINESDGSFILEGENGRGKYLGEYEVTATFNALEKELTTIRQQLDECREALEEVRNAWEVLPSGNYSMRIIQRWLLQQMLPAITKIREALKQSAPPSEQDAAAKVRIVNLKTNHPGNICLTCGYQRSYHSCILKDINACDDFVKSKLED